MTLAKVNSATSIEEDEQTGAHLARCCSFDFSLCLGRLWQSAFSFGLLSSSHVSMPESKHDGWKGQHFMLSGSGVFIYPAWLLSFLLCHGLGSLFHHSEEEIDISPLDRSILSLEDKGKLPSLSGPFDDFSQIYLRAPEI